MNTTELFSNLNMSFRNWNQSSTHTQTHERNHAHINAIIPLPSVAISLCLFLFCQPAIHLLIPTTHTLPLLLHHADPTSTPQPLLWPRSTLPPLISLFFSPPPLPQYLHLFFILSLVLSFASPIFPLFNSYLMLLSSSLRHLYILFSMPESLCGHIKGQKGNSEAE